MKTVLYIEPYSEYGHINLNKVYLRRFAELGLSVHLVAKEGHAAELDFPERQVRLAVPRSLFRPGSGQISGRYWLWRVFRFIKKRIDFSAYDYVFLAGYEEISLYLSGIRNHLLLVNHANVAGLDNFIKRFFNRRLSRYCTHIVFAPYLRERLSHYGIHGARVEWLGLSESYGLDESRMREILGAIDASLVSEKFAHIVFVPSASKYGSDFVSRLAADARFLEFLRENKMLLVVKGGGVISRDEHVITIKGFLNTDEYQALFMKSLAILILYPESFTYRVSASLFECFSNAKACFVSDIESFRVWGGRFNYSPFVREPADLLQAMSEYLALRGSPDFQPYSKVGELNPSFAWMAEDAQGLQTRNNRG